MIHPVFALIKKKKLNQTLINFLEIKKISSTSHPFNSPQKLLFHKNLSRVDALQVSPTFMNENNCSSSYNIGVIREKNLSLALFFLNDQPNLMFFFLYRDVQFKGYTIPKNTEIVPLLYAINNDPELWESPEKFQPSRFINSEGRVVKPDFFIPFGIGK